MKNSADGLDGAGPGHDCDLLGGADLHLLPVTVCIPWRPQPSRLAPYRRVRAFWEATGWPIIESDSDPRKHFNLAQARNNAVRQVTSEYVVISDADVIPKLDNVVQALTTVEEQVIWPYTLHRYISGDWEGDPFDAPVVQLAGMPGQPPEGYREWTGSIYVARLDSFWNVGGFDERFTTWGGEDTCFRIACNTLVGVGRIQGPCVSYNHECPGRNGAANEGGGNSDLLQQYRAADLRPMSMLKLTRDPTRFLPQGDTL